MTRPAQRLRRKLEDIDNQLRAAVDDWPLDDEAVQRVANLEIVRSALARLLSEVEPQATYP